MIRETDPNRLRDCIEELVESISDLHLATMTMAEGLEKEELPESAVSCMNMIGRCLNELKNSASKGLWTDISESLPFEDEIRKDTKDNE